MNILIVGDNPNFHGGVTNYTRALFNNLKDECNVLYLFNGSRVDGYDLLGKRIKKVGDDLFCLYNPMGFEKNYESLECDYGDWLDNIIEKFLINKKIDVVHIHEIFGFSSKLIHIAKALNIKVFVSVHEYWWLCPHRVMIDHNRKVCDGPENIEKCATCIKPKINTNKYRKEKVIIKKILGSIGYNRVKKENAIKFESLDYGDEKEIDTNVDVSLKFSLKSRLDKNIKALNKCDQVICVSNDVKRILGKYGVKTEKMLVQHIGSTIAENRIKHIKPIDRSMIIFGFIGGVTYYKGVHLLVEAYSLLDEDIKSRCRVKVYGGYKQSYYKAIENKYSEELNNGNVKFYGRFTPSDLNAITNKIDISILPSLCADTAPQTIFESYMAQLPIIAPKIGGFSDFVENNYNGLLYDYDSPKQLALKMTEIVLNPYLIERFRNNITKCKTIAQNTKELIDLYNG